MAYGSAFVDTITSSGNLTISGNVQPTAIKGLSTGTPPVFQDSTGAEVGTLCRAWVYFNATSGSPLITGSFNVSSITDNGVGDFTINFTQAMPDANYLAISTAESGSSVSPRTSQSADQAIGNVRIYTQTFQSGVSAGARQDMNYNKLAVFR